MRAIEVVAEVDADHRLQIALPLSVPSGKVRVIVLTPETEEEAVEQAWMEGISREWAAELLDSREDLYTLEDGEPVHAAR